MVRSNVVSVARSDGARPAHGRVPIRGVLRRGSVGSRDAAVPLWCGGFARGAPDRPEAAGAWPSSTMVSDRGAILSVDLFRSTESRLPPRALPYRGCPHPDCRHVGSHASIGASCPTGPAALMSNYGLRRTSTESRCDVVSRQSAAEAVMVGRRLSTELPLLSQPDDKIEKLHGSSVFCSATFSPTAHVRRVFRMVSPKRRALCDRLLGRRGACATGFPLGGHRRPAAWAEWSETSSALR